MSAVAQVHAEHRVAGLQHSGVDRVVRHCPRVRLDVGVLGIEKRLRPLDGERFNSIDVLAAAVVALARVAFRVLVVKERTERLEHRRAGDVLGRDQLERVLLALELVADRGPHLGIDSVDLAGEVGRLQHQVIMTSRGAPSRKAIPAGEPAEHLHSSPGWWMASQSRSGRHRGSGPPRARWI